MSRILKRPMFRIGGAANEDGIMSTVVPKRANYANPDWMATTADNYEKPMDRGQEIAKRYAETLPILQAAAGPGRSERDRALDLLLRGSLRLMSERPAGNIFATAAKSFQEPTEQYLKSGETEDALQRQINLGAASTAMSSVDAERLARDKLKHDFANQTLQARVMDRTKLLANTFGDNAINVAREEEIFTQKFPKAPYVGVLPPRQGKNQQQIPVDPNKIAQAKGKVYYDGYNREFRIFNDDGLFKVDVNSGKLIPVSTAVQKKEEKIARPNPGEWNKQRFWEEYYKNNPDKRPATAEVE